MPAGPRIHPEDAGHFEHLARYLVPVPLPSQNLRLTG